MAGAGFDALAMREAASRHKRKLGRLAYLRGGVRAMRARPVRTKVRVDGASWFKGDATCVLFGNVGTIAGGVEVFPEASADDGLLEVGVATASNVGQWLRVLARVAQGRADRSPLVRTTKAHKVVVELRRATPFELDGGARLGVKRLVARVEPAALTVCVPARRQQPGIRRASRV
jgi:diacylglycerol kinase family enzyme